MSDRLSQLVAEMAGRLADFLAAMHVGEQAAAGVQFLRSLRQNTSSAVDPARVDQLERLPLQKLEREVTVLAGLAEEHEGFCAIFRALHPRGEPRPTAGLAAQLFGLQDRAGFRQMVEAGPLTSWGILKPSLQGPFFERTLELCDQLWPALRGQDRWPAALPRVRGPADRAGLEEWFLHPNVRRAVKALRNREQCTLLVTAENEELAHERGLALTIAAGREATGFLSVPEELRPAIAAHCLIRDAVPVLLVPVPDGPQAIAPYPPVLEGYPDVSILCGREGAVPMRFRRPVVAVPAQRLTTAQRRQMWTAALPGASDEQTRQLATFAIEPAAASDLAADLICLERLEERAIEPADLTACLRARSVLTHSAGIKLIHPQARWESLVLPAEREELLRDAVRRLEHQERVFDDWGFLKDRQGARGVRMLFVGPPGTGKTYSAEVLAGALGRDLLVVDISRVVSKWIGETEKNLASVFDTAERAHAVCFFDEADALFGRRTEVSDAHDRYANLETAYLLSRLERFEGLAILATNLRQNIDPAFLRRMEFVVDFDEPDREERFKLWHCHIPREEQLAPDVNLYEMAALFALAGGFIRNAALAAAFMAAADGGRITQSHLFRAVRREYHKSGRPFPGVPAGTHI